jgi:PH (Pleckstrin Homology) domain-containing protein/putative oligomerization/nucleic acid binding protein
MATGPGNEEGNMAKVPEGLRDDLTITVEGQNTVLGAKKSLRAASDALRPSERVEAATTTMMERGKTTANGALVVTTERLLFVHARGFTQSAEEIPFVNISGVADRVGMASAHVIVTAAGGITTNFRNVPKARHSTVINAIRSHLGTSGVSPPTPSGGSTADELVKLTHLRDSGVLDESEFAAAKARLLS